MWRSMPPTMRVRPPCISPPSRWILWSNCSSRTAQHWMLQTNRDEHRWTWLSAKEAQAGLAPRQPPGQAPSRSCAGWAPADSFQFGRPLPDGASHLDKDILLALPGAFKDTEAMVGSVQRVECHAFTEFLADGLKKVQVRQFVARAAEKEHRDCDRAQVVRALRVRLAGLMQGKGEEDQAVYAIKRGFRGCRGGHAPAEGVAASQEGEGESGVMRCCDCGPDGRRANLLGIASRTMLHVGKVVAEGRYARVGHPLCDGLKRGVSHIRAGPVAEDD